MKKTKILFLSLFLFSQPVFGNPSYLHVKEGLRLVQSEARFLNNECQFPIISIGGGFFDQINSLQLYAFATHKSDIKMARKAFILLLNAWKTEVNKDEAARPYLKNHPFTIKNFEFGLIFEDYDTPSDPHEEKISFVFNNGNTLVYCYRDRVSRMLTVTFRESYEEACQKLLKDLNEENAE